MHPIVIMSYDKSPAITKAVAILEEAGMEVRVLNTANARLADFLGALAGDDDEIPEPASEPDEPEVDLSKDTDKPVADDAVEDEGEGEVATEGLVDDELIKIKLVEGFNLVLKPSIINVGARTTYSLNESEFAFWPMARDDDTLTESVSIKFNAVSEDISGIFPVILSKQASTPATLEVGRAWLKEAKVRSGWAILPASKVLYNKSKVSVDDVREEIGSKGTILICSRETSNGKMQYPVFISSYGSNDKVGTVSTAFHDQTFKDMGTFKIKGILKLGKTADADEYTGEDIDLSTVKAPIFVFK